jgi:IS605 OrfB family transposase
MNYPKIQSAVKTIKIKLQDPSTYKRVILDNAFNVINDAMNDLLEQSSKKFDYEDFVSYNDKNKKPLTKNLNYFMSRIFDDIDVSKYKLNTQLKSGLVYYVACMLKSHISAFLENPSATFPSMKPPVSYETFIDIFIASLNSATSCITLDEERNIRTTLQKKYIPECQSSIYIVRKRDFSICKTTKNGKERYFIFLPFNLQPPRRSKSVKIEDSLLGLINITEDKNVPEGGPWMLFPIEICSRDRDILREVESLRYIKRESKYDKSKPMDISSCIVFKKGGDYFVSIPIVYSVAVQAVSLMSIKLSPKKIAYVVMNENLDILEVNSFSKDGLIAKIRSLNIQRKMNQRSGKIAADTRVQYESTTFSHLMTNHLVAIAKKYKSLILLQDLTGIKDFLMSKNLKVPSYIGRYIRRSISMWDYRRFSFNIRYKCIIAGLPGPYYLKKLKLNEFCGHCRAPLSLEDLNFSEDLCECKQCKRSELLEINASIGMINVYKDIQQNKEMKLSAEQGTVNNIMS